MVGQVNADYESQDPRMAKYVSLVKQHLGSLEAWKLEHIPRDCNEKASGGRNIVPTHLLSVGFFNYHYPGKSGGRGLIFLDGPHSTIYQHERTPNERDKAHKIQI